MTMKIFKRLNKKEMLKKNLQTIRDFNLDKLEAQKEELIEWERSFYKELSTFELLEDNETYLLDYISRKFNNLKDMKQKIEDFKMVEEWFKSKEKKDK